MSILYQGNGEKILTSEMEAHLSSDLTLQDGLEATQQFVYVSQDNYFFSRVDELNSQLKIYCDSATSCIIMVVTGKMISNTQGIFVSHLSRPGRFDSFFRMVKNIFNNTDGINIYAAGANPAQPCLTKDGEPDRTALRNAKQVSNWVANCPLTVNQVTLRFGEGNPSIYTNNLDCLVVDRTLEVKNERLYLTNKDRDRTGGVQTLFCMYADPNALHNGRFVFKREETSILVDVARRKGFEKAATMSDSEILKTYSSTPDYEVPWFCSTIREAGIFTKNYR